VIEGMVCFRHALQHAVLKLVLSRSIAFQLLARDLLVQHPFEWLLHEDNLFGESSALDENLVQLQEGGKFLVVDLALQPQQRLVMVTLVLVVLVNFQSDQTVQLVLES
jgi:hypothetical protein